MQLSMRETAQIRRSLYPSRKCRRYAAYTDVQACRARRVGMTPAELCAQRQALHLSQAALAGMLGVTRNTLARWERGDLPISKPVLVRLALERLGGISSVVPTVPLM